MLLRIGRLALIGRKSTLRSATGCCFPEVVFVPSTSTRLASSKRKQSVPAVTDLSNDDADDVDPAKIKAAMDKHIAHTKKELAKIRGAAADPAMLDHVQVVAYGETQPLKAVSQIVLKSSTLLLVTPFDTSLCEAAANAIREAGLSLNPGVDGNSVKVPIPKPSAETREAALKVVSKIAEATKARIRRTRQAAIDNLKKSGGSSDDLFRQTKDIQEVTTASNDELAKLAEAKKAEISAAGSA